MKIITFLLLLIAVYGGYQWYQKKDNIKKEKEIIMQELSPKNRSSIRSNNPHLKNENTGIVPPGTPNSKIAPIDSNNDSNNNYQDPSASPDDSYVHDDYQPELEQPQVEDQPQPIDEPVDGYDPQQNVNAQPSFDTNQQAPVYNPNFKPYTPQFNPETQEVENNN